MTILEEKIIKKIHKEDSGIYDTGEAYEQDNLPNPFRDLTIEELEYLREHRYLLESVFPEAFPIASGK